MTINPQAVRGPVTAVPVVAGKGVRLVADTENNRIVAEADETVLWENAAGSTASSGVSLSESPYNFEKIAIHVVDNNGNGSVQEIPMGTSPSQFVIMIAHINNAATGVYLKTGKYTLNSTTLTFVTDAQTAISGSSVNNGFGYNNLLIYKVVGINRISASA